MKICLLSRYMDLRNAGLGRVTSELAFGLIKRGHAVTMVTDASSGVGSYFAYDGINILSKIPRDNIDVYQSISPSESLWIPKQKSVCLIADLILITHPERAGAGAHKNWLNYLALKWGFRLSASQAKHCARIVTISEESKSDIVNYLNVPAEKVKVIRLGIRDDLEPMPRRDGVFRIGYLGQLDRRKRVDLLIGGFRQSDIDGELVIAGRGTDEWKLKLQAQGDKRIKFVGFVLDEKLGEFYNTLSLFCFPSWIEGYGLPIVESFACKKPVAILEDAILPQDISQRCIKIPMPINDDTEGAVFIARWFNELSRRLRSKNLANSYLNYLNNHIRYSAGEGDWIDWLESNYRFAKLHSWAKCVEEYENVYKEVCY